MSQAQTQALAFVAAAKAQGFTWAIRAGVLTIRKTFTPGSADGFTQADAMAGSILALAPLSGGSVWGTDGGSVGGYVGMKNGEYVLNKSGRGARFMKALAAAR